MSVQERMGPSNWQLLCNAPLTIWLGVSTVDAIAGSDRKEVAAFDRALADSAKQYADSELISGVIADAKKPSSKQKHGGSSVTVPQLLKRLRRVSKLLAAEVDSEGAEQFTKFLLDVGWQVARAASESPFAACRVSVAEEQFLYDAARALRSGGAADVA